MALLRNREVTIVGPASGDTPSPLYTVQYPDGNREDIPLKFIQMSESEHKEWAKNNPHLADHIRTVSDKEHQDIVDSQDRKKIEERQKKGELNQDQMMVPVKTFVRPADVQKEAPNAVTANQKNQKAVR